MNQKRIWEIDALRGFLILCVILSHTLYYSSNILGLFRIPPLIRYVMQYGGALFVILCGAMFVSDIFYINTPTAAVFWYLLGHALAPEKTG